MEIISLKKKEYQWSDKEIGPFLDFGEHGAYSGVHPKYLVGVSCGGPYLSWPLSPSQQLSSLF